jgi:type II secretory pathway pseudopilin PulG
MNFFDKCENRKPVQVSGRSQEQGFTLMETAVALVMMMVVSLGVASLFAYSTNANSNADDRELAMAIAQKRMEWLRTIPFTTQTRQLAYSFPNGGLAATATAGVIETVTNAGRPYQVKTVIQDTTVVPAGNPDEGAPTVKTITLTVTPFGAASVFSAVVVSTQRTTQVTGIY